MIRHHVLSTLLITGLLAGSGCAKGGLSGPAPGLDDRAVAGIADRGLQRLLDDHWRLVLAASPEWATHLGYRAYDDRVADRSLAATQAHQAATRALLERARAAQASDLSETDRLYLDLLIGRLEADVAEAVCRFEQWSLSPRMNAMADLLSVLDVQPLDTDDEVTVAVRRIEDFAAKMPGHLEALRAGLAEGWVVNRTSLDKVVAMVDDQLATEPAAWAVAERTDDPRFAQALADHAVPALRAYRTLLVDTLRPAARSDDAPGLASLPDGAACYEARIRRYTTLPLTAAEVHETGLDALRSIHEEFVAPGAEVFGVWDTDALFARLRTDPSLRFETAEQIVDKAEEALRRAEAAVPRVFGILPDTPCVIAVIPEHEAPYTTIAYYRQPSPDGSKPGEYFVNTYQPETRPRHEAEVLAFHESVPGHHLQIARSFELEAVPAFHRYGGSTAFVEGWALYTERLADELGLYSGPTDRLGMLSFDAWRASRLAVDTGLHHLGWSRAEAEDFMRRHTPLADNNIVNEVDRYITWPGQALAYKIGQLEIRALRAEAEAALGDRFELSAFHDVVLGQGALSLPKLRERVMDWVASQQP